MANAAQKDNIHHDIAGEDILSKQSAEFRKYRLLWEENPKNLTPGSFPLHLDIETTSACNLKCPFCATTYSKFNKGFMTWDIAKKILDEAGREGLYACKFNFRGEPLLHKDIGKFICYAKEKGILDVFFNTNGSLLNAKKARMLIESGLDRLTVSVEGFDKESYERNRVGSKFEEIVANIEELRELREKMGRSTPKIRVQAVLVPEMKEKLNEYVDFWRERVDQVSYNDLEPSVETVLNKIEQIESDWICPFPYQRMTVMWDGAITACKNDYFGKLAMGNVENMTLKEAWEISLEKVRKVHREGLSHEIEACRECPLRASELTKSRKIP